MDFSLADEQDVLCSALRSFLDTSRAEARLDELEERGARPEDLVELLAKPGLLVPGVREEFGGSAGGLVELAIVGQELDRYESSII